VEIEEGLVGFLGTYNWARAQIKRSPVGPFLFFIYFLLKN
jgi:hypothetical protein